MLDDPEPSVPVHSTYARPALHRAWMSFGSYGGRLVEHALGADGSDAPAPMADVDPPAVPVSTRPPQWRRAIAHAMTVRECPTGESVALAAIGIGLA